MSDTVINISGLPLKTRSVRDDWIEAVPALGRDKAPTLALETLLAEGRELAWAQAIKLAGADDDAIKIWDEAEQEWLVDAGSIGDPEIRERVAHYSAVVCRIDVFIDDFRKHAMRAKGAGR